MDGRFLFLRCSIGATCSDGFATPRGRRLTACKRQTYARRGSLSARVWGPAPTPRPHGRGPRTRHAGAGWLPPARIRDKQKLKPPRKNSEAAKRGDISSIERTENRFTSSVGYADTLPSRGRLPAKRIYSTASTMF